MINALEIVDIDIVKIKMFDSTVSIKVQYVRGVKKNILFLKQIDSLRCKSHVENEITKIFRGMLVLMKAGKIGANLFILTRNTL